MGSLLPSRIFGRKLQDVPAALAASAASAVEALTNVVPEDHLTDRQESRLLQTVGWVSAALGAVAIGLFIGRELRQRYKFNRRTPYDFYAHSGDESDLEFGVGI
jgi:hypothetical protein